MKDFSYLNNDEILQICNEIYEWKTGEGTLNQEGLLKKIFKENKNNYFSIYYLAEDILNESHKRFGNLIKLLLVDKPFLYIR